MGQPWNPTTSKLRASIRGASREIADLESGTRGEQFKDELELLRNRCDTDRAILRKRLHQRRCIAGTIFLLLGVLLLFAAISEATYKGPTRGMSAGAMFFFSLLLLTAGGLLLWNGDEEGL